VVETAGGIQIGATETCMIMYGCQWVFTCLPNTNTSAAITVLDLSKSVGIEVTIGDLIAFSTFVLSVQYNLGNFYEGVKESSDKFHTISCTLPFF
jgi:hypothetical protein